MFVDVGYLSFRLAASESYGNNVWPGVDLLVDQGAKFCLDSRTSYRRTKHPWYKSQRKFMPQVTKDLQLHARKIQKQIADRYPFDIFEEDGLEADDLIALHAQDGDWIMTTDKDMLQLPGMVFIDKGLVPWGFDRVQKKAGKRNISCPECFLAYQLVYGDIADNIPKLAGARDKKLIDFIFSQQHPLWWAINLFPEQKVKASLECLIIPTPLYKDHDPIAIVVERYGLKEG